MTDWREMVVFGIAAPFVALQVFWAWRFVLLYLRSREDPPLPDDRLPPAAIVFSVRGEDATLEACVRGLLNQDYPRYELHIVVDSEDDPAWKTVTRAIEECARPNVDVRLSVLRERKPTCTLKVSSHWQAVQEVGAHVEMIAFIDADAVPPPSWLRRLAEGLADPEVGCVSGVRWYAPREPNMGSLVRYLWNGCGYCHQLVFGHPWGGTTAYRAQFFRSGEIPKEWEHAFSDDSSAGEVVRRSKMRIHFVPALTMPDEGNITLAGCFRFIRRQLLCPRCDMSNWPWWLAAIIGTTYLPIVALLIAGIGAINQDWARVGWFGGLFAFYAVGLFVPLSMFESCLRRMIHRQGRAIPPNHAFWRVIPAIVMTQLVFSICVPAAVLLRRVTWRGVSYAIGGPRKVRLLEDSMVSPKPAPVEQPVANNS